MRRGILSICSILTPVFLLLGSSAILIYADQENASENCQAGWVQKTEEAQKGVAADSPAVENGLADTTKKKKSADTEIFVRIQKNDLGQDTALETSMVTYRSENENLEVTLIGAIHLGEKAYYEELNTNFKNYDVVLYEVVAEEGTRPGGVAERNGSIISLLQYSMARAMNLEFQLHYIDYSPENMVHADMTPQEFSDAMKARQESFLTMYLRTVGYAIGNQNARQDAKQVLADAQNLRELAFGQNKSLTLKRMMATEMGDLNQSIAPIEGKDGSAILTDRNAKVVRILREQMDAGKQKIAIFYGAAHLPDFARQLENEFQLQRGDIRWLKAWKLE